ncbi:MAG: FapA family protein [Candidatus Hydrogenedentota bacterium]
MIKEIRKLDDRARRAYIKINVSPNQLKATCKIDIPEELEPVILTKEDIKAALKLRGVVFGINEEIVNDIINPPYRREVVIAEGKPKKNGEDAKLEYLFDLGKLTPKELEDGRVDFFELGYVKNVVEGQILVKKIPPTSGEAGMTVTGKRIEPISGRDKKLPMGKNTEISPNGLELRATTQGHVYIKNNKVMVENIFVISSDIDVSTGHIDFLGRVIVHGDVADRIRITARDDIEIYGDVRAATIKSTEGSIKISRAIFGRNSAFLKAKKNISARFVEQARLEAGGDVIVQEYILHSEVRCEGKIAVLGKPGIIAGGSYYCIESLYTNDLGSESGVKTQVEVNDFTAPKLQEEMSKLLDERSVLKAKLAPLERALKDLREIGIREDALATQRREELLELVKPFRYLYPQLCLLEDEVEEKKKFFKTLSSPQEVVCLGRIYPGVIIKIGPDEVVIKAMYSSKRFVLINNKSISVRDVRAGR